MADKQDGTDGAGWAEWSQWVRKGIEELKDKVEKVHAEVIEQRVELAVIKVKLTLWGFVGSSVATLLINFLFHHFTTKGGTQ